MYRTYNVCQQCNHPNESWDEFCSNCGSEELIKKIGRQTSQYRTRRAGLLTLVRQEQTTYYFTDKTVSQTKWEDCIEHGLL